MFEQFIIEPKFCIDSGYVPSIGELIGYDYNDVCDMVNVDSLYGEDGAGYCTVSRDFKFKSEGLNKIFEKLFADNPECKTIYILNDW